MPDFLRCGLSLARSLSSHPKLLSMGRYGPWLEVGKPAPGTKKQRSSEWEISGPPKCVCGVCSETEQNRTRGQQGTGFLYKFEKAMG